jgi:hypothetical protein
MNVLAYRYRGELVVLKRRAWVNLADAEGEALV